MKDIEQIFFSFNPVMYLIYNINGFLIYATNKHTAVIFVLVCYVCDS